MLTIPYQTDKESRNYCHSCQGTQLVTLITRKISHNYFECTKVTQNCLTIFFSPSILSGGDSHFSLFSGTMGKGEEGEEGRGININGDSNAPPTPINA